MPELVVTFKKEILSIQMLLMSVLIALIYFSFAIYLLNYRLVLQTLLGNFPLLYKVHLLWDLLGGVWTAFTFSDAFLLITTAILVGINGVLLLKTVKLMENNGSLRVSIGGSSILALVSTGCASCGFSVLSLVGLGAGIGVLSSAAFGLHILSIGLLFFSCIYILLQLQKKSVCKVSSQSQVL